MSPCCCHFQCTFYVFLPFYICEVQIKATLLCIKLFAGVDNGRSEFLLPIEEFYYLFDVFNSIYLNLIDYSRFKSVLSGYYDSLES